MTCSDCDYRQKGVHYGQKGVCFLFDDIIFYGDSCFMDTNKDDFSIIENDSCISRIDR